LGTTFWIHSFGPNLALKHTVANFRVNVWKNLGGSLREFRPWSTKAVFRVREILIRIRILLFSSVILRIPTKNKILFSEFVLLIIFISAFKDKKSLRSRLRGEIKVFLYFLLVDVEGSRGGP
jgi:hypothetical protein